MPTYKDKERNTWYCSFYYKDWTGARKLKKKRGFKTQREAKEFEREFLLKYANDPEMTFASLVDLYFKDLSHRIRNSTVAMKKNVFETHILPYFGNLRISDIDVSIIRKWQNEILKLKNRQTGEPFSPTYLRTINTQLSAVLNYAVQFYKLPYNPCHKIKAMGKKQAEEMSFWTLDEFNAAIAYENKPVFHLALMLLYWTGMREGELLALTPNKIIDDTKSINIIHTYKRENGKDVFSPPKTKNSIRQTPLPAFLYDELRDYVDGLYGIEPDDRIFYFSKTALGKEVDLLCKKSGVKRIRVHDLRHSHVSLLVELGYSILAIANRIGDTPETVEKTYAHLYPNKSIQIAKELEKHQNGIVDVVEIDLKSFDRGIKKDMEK